MIKRIAKFTNSPKVLLFGWLIFLFSPIIGIMRLKILTDPKLSIFHISGLSTALFYTPFLVSTGVFLIIISWFIEFTKGNLTDTHQKYFSRISILTFFALSFYQYLINLEFIYYPNYLYQHYGITTVQLQLMSFVAALQIMFFFTFYVYRASYKSSKIKTKKKLSYKKPYFYIAILGILSLFILSGATVLSYRVLIGHSMEGYEGKIGVDYKYIELLSETSESAVVIHPPQGDKWPAIGNQPVLRYFVYPRHLVSGALITSQEFTKQVNPAYFVIIDPEGSREWPSINTQNRRISFNEVDYVNFKNLTLFFENDVSRIYKIDF